MQMDHATRRDMLNAIPRLKAFAASLCHNSERADDLVQETLLRACANFAQYRQGKNIMPWLVTILRNQFYTEYRKYRREVADIDGAHAAMLASPADQYGHVEYGELHRALDELPDEMREAIVMVGAHGLSYEEAAQAQNCPIGTIKSRVHRARAFLASKLDFEEASPVRSRRASTFEAAAERSL